MLTDAEIAHVRSQIEPVVGPTYAGWYEEACKIQPGETDAPHDVVLWACRAREAIFTKARDMGEVASALRELIDTCKKGIKFGVLTSACMSPLDKALENAEKALWWQK